MILLIDNYDSFSYNLFQLIGEVQKEKTEDPADILVIRNDVCSVEEIAAMDLQAIVISPGPGKCENAGICVEMVHRLAGQVPILGVCLGHQAICRAFGASIGYANELMHGKPSRLILEKESPLFLGLSSGMQAGRYHSLSVVENTLPETLEVTARSEDGEVMAVEHRDFPVYGVQFHPESVLTPDGLQIMRNFLNRITE